MVSPTLYMKGSFLTRTRTSPIVVPADEYSLSDPLSSARCNMRETFLLQRYSHLWCTVESRLCASHVLKDLCRHHAVSAHDASILCVFFAEQMTIGKSYLRSVRTIILPHAHPLTDHLLCSTTLRFRVTYRSSLDSSVPSTFSSSVAGFLRPFLAPRRLHCRRYGGLPSPTGSLGHGITTMRRSGIWRIPRRQRKVYVRRRESPENGQVRD